MTPCEELGYKVGDKFKVTRGSDKENVFSVGSIISLKKDDGSKIPLFTLEQGRHYTGRDIGCCELRKLTKIAEKLVSSERKDTYVCLRGEGIMFTEGKVYKNLSEREGTLAFMDNEGRHTEIYGPQLSAFIKESEVSSEEKEEDTASNAVNTEDSKKQQVGGSHYLDMGLQPLEICLANKGYEAFAGSCYTKVLKYTSRIKDDEVEQLKKARHVLDMWIEEAIKQKDDKGEVIE